MLNTEPMNALSCSVPGLSLSVAHRRSTRSYDPDGIYLLQRYETEQPDIIREQQRRAADRERSPLRSLLPPSVDSAEAVGSFRVLCEVADVSRAVPFADRLSDPGANASDLKATIAYIATALRTWNPAHDLSAGRSWLPGHEWLRRFTPFSSATHAAESLLIGGKVRHNPAAYAMQAELWAGAMQIPALNGLVHGRLDAAHMYLARQPFLVDVRGYQEDAPVLLDWATLELSLLLSFMPHQSSRDWSQWLTLCETLSSAILPASSPPGRDAPLAVELISPLRMGISAYIAEFTESLREPVALSFWLSATIAGLRVYAEPNSDDFSRKAALAYASCAFAQVAESLRLPNVGKKIETLDIDQPLTVLRTAQIDKRAAEFPHGYALVIGVSAQKDPALDKQQLPVTADDAGAITRFLTEQSGYHLENVHTLIGAQTTRDGIKTEFEWLAKQAAADDNATVLVYYSGHGGVSSSHYFLIPYDVRIADLANTALPMPTFDGWLHDIGAKRLVVLLDCCHAGSATLKAFDPAFSDFTPKAMDPAALGSGTGRVLIASSTESQQSYILAKHPNSLFTEVLLEALAQPGEIEVFDVFRTLRDEVSRRASIIGAEQTPRFHAKDVDKIVLAVR